MSDPNIHLREAGCQARLIAHHDNARSTLASCSADAEAAALVADWWVCDFLTDAYSKTERNTEKSTDDS